jgi:hypothetical protein
MVSKRQAGTYLFGILAISKRSNGRFAVIPTFAHVLSTASRCCHGDFLFSQATEIKEKNIWHES